MPRTKGALTKKPVWLCRVSTGDVVQHDEHYPSLAAMARGLGMSYNQCSEIAKGRTKMKHPKYKFHPTIRIERISNAPASIE